MVPDALLGPLALTVGAVLALGYVTRFIVQFIRETIADLKQQRDEAIAGWRDQVAATDRLANVIEVRTKRDAARTRSDDKA